jgi:chromosome segregation ATPase
MGISGSQLYRQISDVRSSLGMRIGAANGQVLDLNNQIGYLLSEQADLWTQLAKLQIDLGFDLPKQIDTLMASRRDRLDGQKEVIANGERTLQSLVSAHEAREQELQQTQAAFDEHEQTLKAGFEADDAAVTLRRDVAAKGNALAAAREKLARAEEERDTKSPAYEQDELFAYLRSRGSSKGTVASGLTGRLDAWLGRIVGYDKASADFDRLQQIPEWNRSRVQVAQQEFDDISAKLRKIEETTFASLLPFKEKLRTAGKALDAAAEAIASEHRAISGAQKTVAAAAAAQDEDLKRITKELATQLETIDLRSLQQAASRTATDEDDKIVAAIVRIRNDLSDLQAQSRKASHDVTALKNRADEYESIEGRLRSNGWHHSDHSFDGIGPVVSQMDMGVITSAALWEALSSSHVAPRPTYTETVTTGNPWGGASSSSSWGSSSDDDSRRTSSWSSSSSASDWSSVSDSNSSTSSSDYTTSDSG